MSKLESIVPPLELCELIPAGEFEDSVLVWTAHGVRSVEELSRLEFCKNLPIRKLTFPAPTQEEIRRELRNLSVNVIDGVITVSCRINPEDTIFETARDDNDVTAAALRMWLRIRREAGR